MKKIIVDENSCIGCGACISIDPTHFNFSDDGLSDVISNENLDTEDLTNAIESCPTNAISIGEDNHNCKCSDCSCEVCECTEDACNCEGCQK